MGRLCIWQVAGSVSTKDRYPAPKCHHITQTENIKTCYTQLAKFHKNYD